MRLLKKWAAVLLSVCLILSSSGIRVQAEESAENGKNVMQGLAGSTGEENAETGQTVQDLENSRMEGKAKTEEEQEILPGKLNFVMQESTFVETPGTQNIVADLGEEGKPAENAQLCYQNSTGENFTKEAAGIVDSTVKFTMDFTDEDQADIYKLASIQYVAEGKTYQVNFAELGMEVEFGVNCQTETEPDELLFDKELLEEVEANVVTLDENGTIVSENNMENVLEASEGLQRFSRGRAVVTPSEVKNMRIMLDPGHDSTHAGARGNGCKEEEAVLKIAQYCKAELQKYAGVSVYMTRESNTCPFGGSKVSSSTCNAQRVELAKDKKADVYVSFHLNSSPSSLPSGVGVYYPNSSYRPAIGEEGKGLATEIYKKLSALGLDTWAGGVLIHNSENNTLYPDGSLADYLAVIRRSKLAGIPAVLIEHAFLSNSGDVSKFLNSDTKLKNLGLADAKGIVQYYGLTVGTSQPEIQWIQPRGSKKLRISWNQAVDAESYQVYRSDSEAGEYKKIAELRGDVYDDEKIKPGITYYYKVCAVYSDGNKSSFSRIYPGSSLAAPVINGIVSRSGGKLDIKWDAIEGAKSYDLWRSDAKDGTYRKIANLAGNAYVDQNLEMQKEYFYKVRARGGEQNGYSSYSKILSGWAVQKTSISSVSSKTSTSLLIRWKKVDNAYAYRIQRADSKKGKYKVIATVKNGKTSYIDEKVKEKKTYYYKVQTINRVNNKSGYSGYCKAVFGQTITGTSMIYVRSKSSGSMELKWKKHADAYAYSVKRSTKKSGEYTKIAELRDRDITKYVDKNVTGGKKYFYVVEVITKKNKVKNYSGDSKPKSAFNLKKISISSIQAGKNGITLSWKKADGANTYIVLRSNSASSGFQQIAKIKNADYTSFTDKNVTAGKRYYYRVRAIREGKYTGYGSSGKIAEKWMLPAPKGLKVTASRPSVTPDSPGTMQLQWEKVKGATGYAVLRAANGNPEYEMIAMVSGNGTVSYKDSKVSEGTVYYYKVAAVGTIGKETGNGDETAPVSAVISTVKKK